MSVRQYYYKDFKSVIPSGVEGYSLKKCFDSAQHDCTEFKNIHCY
jgi:hypothetical protein